MSELRRSGRLSNSSTSSNSEEGWYLLFFPKVGTDGAYGIYKQSQIKIRTKNGDEIVKVNNLGGEHEFEVLRLGKKNLLTAF